MRSRRPPSGRLCDTLGSRTRSRMTPRSTGSHRCRSGYVRDRCLGGCDVTMTETTLGGELAERAADHRRGSAGDLRLDLPRPPARDRVLEPAGRCPGPRADGSDPRELHVPRCDTGGPGGGRPTTFVDPTELVLYTNAELGYEILLPRFWGVGDASEPLPDHAAVRRRDRRRHAGWPQFSISVGEPDGTVGVCHGVPEPCETLAATSLDELEALLGQRPRRDRRAVPDERRRRHHPRRRARAVQATGFPT